MKLTNFPSSLFASIGIKGRIAATVLGTLVVAGWLLLRPPTESWVDMARSHTGQEIKVNRVVEYHFGQGELSQALTRYPSQYSLNFTNPATGKQVAWEGERYVHPVLLDVVDGTPWLVINSSRLNSNSKDYGCPEIAYVFLSYKQGRWIPVAPSGAPSELRDANLSYDYGPHMVLNSRTITAETIASDLRSTEVSTSGHLNVKIPRSLEQWQYKYKTAYMTRRDPNDCRAPLLQPVNYIAERPSTQVELETLSSGAVEPELQMRESPNSSESLWGNYSWDKNRVLACKDRVQAADEQDQRLTTWQRFTADVTKTKVFPNGYSWFCDPEVVWIFGHGMVEPGRMVVTKATNAGDILYKVSFAKPPIFLGTGGAIRYSTFHAKDGFVEFEWVGVDSGGYDWRVKHLAKFRFKEPDVTQAASSVKKTQ